MKKLWNSLAIRIAVITLGLLVLLLVSLPAFLIWEQSYEIESAPPSFPVTVNPTAKTITEDPAVESMLAAPNAGFSAAVFNAGDVVKRLAEVIIDSPVSNLLAATDARIIEIPSGSRKEEVANLFGKALAWSTSDKKSFLDTAPTLLPDGEFPPGTYLTGVGATPEDINNLLSDRFNTTILSHYGTSTAEAVPLTQAMTIASMIERETKDRTEMRMISGIMWNRIFMGMKLQVDPTVQYAKASAQTTPSRWWPVLGSKDKFIKSPYNTYQISGLPPAPISNPSVAAVLAALNPKKTDCLFYFHDKKGDFHCTETYVEHVALLKKYYGQGK